MFIACTFYFEEIPRDQRINNLNNANYSDEDEVIINQNDGETDDQYENRRTQILSEMAKNNQLSEVERENIAENFIAAKQSDFSQLTSQESNIIPLFFRVCSRKEISKFQRSLCLSLDLPCSLQWVRCPGDYHYPSCY